MGYSELVLIFVALLGKTSSHKIKGEQQEEPSYTAEEYDQKANYGLVERCIRVCSFCIVGP